MATVSQPGSRAGLISALVIFVIMFFVAAIFAVMKNSDLKVAEKRLKDQDDQYTRIITKPELSGSEMVVGPLREAAGNAGMSYYTIANRDRDDLSRAITGQPMTKGQAVDAGNKAVEQANKLLQPHGVTVPGGAMVTAVDVLSRAIVQRSAQVTELQSQLAALNEQLKGHIAAYEKASGVAVKGMEDRDNKTRDVVAEGEKFRAVKDAQISSLEKTLAQAIESGRKAADDLQAQITTQLGELDKLKKLNRTLVEQIASRRPVGNAIPMIRRADGKIIQVNTREVVYINRGLGEQITPGMTFQIYDKSEGIPRTGDTRGGDEELPPGKGSLEVVRVSQGSSECRIIKMAAGQQPAEGDLIANVVYEPGTKFKFHVYGAFDLDRNGVATANEAEVVKRLIVQWGGEITDRIAIETDFVVMGKEPVLPNWTKEQQDEDPIKKFDVEKAKEALDKFTDVQNNALALHIPVLNQNRFLYMVGFFDQARK